MLRLFSVKEKKKNKKTNVIVSSTERSILLCLAPGVLHCSADGRGVLALGIVQNKVVDA